jgi:hypothetical protein
LAFKIIAILHNTLLATFIKLLETVTNGLFRNHSQDCCSWIAAMSAKREPFMMLFRQGNRKKSTHRMPPNWHPQVPDQGSTVDFCFTA